MKRTVIICDACGRETSEDAARGWGILAIATKPTRDVCPGCMAKLTGWNPNSLPTIEPFPHARVS